MEFFVKRESERAAAAGRKLFLWGHSMVCTRVLRIGPYEEGQTDEQGGAQTIAFVTRPSAPPCPSTLSLLTGAIISGPLIRQTNPAPSLQVKVGGLAARITPNLLISTPLKYEHLSNNPAMNEANRLDQPMCEQYGSVKGVADMLQGGVTLDTPETWARWPKELSLMMYHGGEDQICDPEATKRFFKGVEAPDKYLHIFEVSKRLQCLDGRVY